MRRPHATTTRLSRRADPSAHAPPPYPSSGALTTDPGAPTLGRSEPRPSARRGIRPRRWAPLAPAVMLALGACGSEPEGGLADNACGFEDPDCLGCAELGECCLSSGNCPVATICNLPSDPLFDPSAAEGRCLKVTCETDGDCTPPRVCGLDRLCGVPACQVDADCQTGQVCRAGRCEAPPDATEVAACEVVTPSGALAPGGTVRLSALARDASGRILAGVAFVWSSDRPDVASVVDGVATGEDAAGTAQLEASVEGGGPACSGVVALTNYPPVDGGVRVITVRDGDEAPLSGLTVVAEAGEQVVRQTTDEAGVARFDGLTEAPDRVTVVGEGYDTVTVVRPGTRGIYLAVPAPKADDRAGGFRGLVDISSTDRGDIQLGFVGPAIPANLLDFGLEALVGDLITTELDAAELMLELVGEEAPDLPGGLLAALGMRRFMADGTGPRCQGASVLSGRLGCFLARAPEGRTAGWGFAGQLELRDVTPIISTLSDVLGGDGDVPLADLVLTFLPLLRNLNHALVASLDVDYVPKLDGRADFRRYQRQDLVADQPLEILSRVSIPDLPGGPGRCADAAVLLGGAILDGRGLVPLGVTAGLDVLEPDETPDCRVAGLVEPFGPGSADTAPSQLALSMAPLHAGGEGSETFLLLVAANVDELLGEEGLRATGLVSRTPDGVAPSQVVPGPFLALPTGEVELASARIRLGEAVAGAVVNRIEVQGAAGTWIVYAPAELTSVSLPAVEEVRALAEAPVESAYILSLATPGVFADAFRLASGRTLNRLVTTLEAFSVQECVRAEGAPCRIR